LERMWKLHVWPAIPVFACRDWETPWESLISTANLWTYIWIQYLPNALPQCSLLTLTLQCLTQDYNPLRVMPCSLAHEYRHFGGTSCLHLHCVIFNLSGVSYEQYCYERTNLEMCTERCVSCSSDFTLYKVQEQIKGFLNIWYLYLYYT
jgi:hypothetical protein